jgi:type II secretory pathway component PulF
MLSPILIILGIILGMFATFVVPGFESVYQSFGADIPMPTGFVFRFRFLLWLPLFLTAISFLWPRLQVVHLRYYLLGAMSETMLLLLVPMALYAPIFKFGCVSLT